MKVLATIWSQSVHEEHTGGFLSSPLCNKAYKCMLNSQGLQQDLSIYLIRLSAILGWDDLSVQQPKCNDMSKTRGEEMSDESCSLPIASGRRLFTMS